MDIRQLQFLCALADERHFGRAAERCHVTQPTLSMRLRQLEEELGVTLVERGARFEGLTRAGEKLLPWARQSLQAFHGMQREAGQLRGKTTGLLRLGAVPMSTTPLLRLVQALSAQAPDVDIHITHASAETLLDSLKANALDVALTYLDDTETHGLHLTLIAPDEFVLLYHPAHFPDLSALDNSTIDLAQVAALPLGMLSKQMRFRQRLDQCLQTQQHWVTPHIEVDSASLLRTLTEQGLCCSIFPSSEPKGSLSSLTIRSPLPPPALVLSSRADDARDVTLLVMQLADTLMT